MRVVLDPGTLISAILSPVGVPARIVRAWHEGPFELVTSPMLLAELAGVPARPRFAHLPAEALAALIRSLREQTIHLPDPAARRAWTRDPADDYLVELAIEAGAIIVSGDRDITEADLPVPALTPRQFSDRLDR